MDLVCTYYMYREIKKNPPLMEETITTLTISLFDFILPEESVLNYKNAKITEYYPSGFVKRVIITDTESMSRDTREKLFMIAGGNIMKIYDRLFTDDCFDHLKEMYNLEIIKIHNTEEITRYYKSFYFYKDDINDIAKTPYFLTEIEKTVRFLLVNENIEDFRIKFSSEYDKIVLDIVYAPEVV